jgi:hypothetical protein
MTGPESSSEAGAQQSADRLALALEDVGFDVGRSFPMLGCWVDRDGTPLIELGYVTELVAAQLTAVLGQATQHGITVPIG